MSARPDIRLVVPAESANVAIVRQAIAGLAEELGVEDDLVDDLKTVVTEACMNVVRHAYGEQAGPLDVTASADERWLRIVVRDWGAGIKPRVSSPEAPSLRLGLPLISAMSDQFAILGDSTGTEVRIGFDLDRERNGDRAPVTEAPALSDARAVLELGPMGVGTSVLTRVIGLAAQRMPLDRLSDAQLAGDMLAAHGVESTADALLRVELSDSDRGLTLRIGPLDCGAAAGLLERAALPGHRDALRSLAEVDVESQSDADGTAAPEWLVLHFLEQTA